MALLHGYVWEIYFNVTVWSETLVFQVPVECVKTCPQTHYLTFTFCHLKTIKDYQYYIHVWHPSEIPKNQRASFNYNCSQVPALSGPGMRYRGSAISKNRSTYFTPKLPSTFHSNGNTTERPCNKFGHMFLFWFTNPSINCRVVLGGWGSWNPKFKFQIG